MEKKWDLRKITYTGVMAAIVCVLTFLRIPFLGSKVHMANAACLLAGLLLGPWYGGAAAGIGSGLYDGLFGGYDIIQCLITVVSKFAMGYIAAKIGYEKKNKIVVVVASVVGALSYVALYMLKTFIYQAFVYGYPMETVTATMLAKLPASLINAVFAMIVAPIAYAVLLPALKKAHLL